MEPEKMIDWTAVGSRNGHAIFHDFRPKDPGGSPMGLGKMSARDRWRYDQSLARFRAKYGEPKPLIRGEIGTFDCVRIIKG